jgi:hypothetical protein
MVVASYQAKGEGAMAPTPNVTERQAKYFASLQASLKATTGKSLDEWVTVAKTCPETGHRARLKWFKEHHGLLQNRASYVLSQAFGGSSAWDEPGVLIAALWSTPGARAIFEAVDDLAQRLPGSLRTARKGYTAWSREFQYAAARPLKGGELVLGLALSPDSTLGLEAPKSETWSERLKSRVRLSATEDVNERLAELVEAAWQRS